MNRLTSYFSDFSHWQRSLVFAGIFCAASAIAQAPQWQLDFPTVAKTDFVTQLTPLSNGDWYIIDSSTRLHLTSQLGVFATAPTFYTSGRKSIEIDNQVIEIAAGTRFGDFSGISQLNFSIFNAPINRQCSVTRFFADLSVRWHQIIKGSSCSTLSAAEDGSLWLSGSKDILNLRADGTIRRQIGYTDEGSPYQSILGISAARGANLGGAFISFKPKMANAEYDFGIAYIDANGQERWQYRAVAASPSLAGVAPRLTPAIDGGVYIGSTTLVRLDASGQLAKQFDSGTYVFAEALAADQSIVVLTQNNSQCALSKFSSANASVWRTPISCDLTTPRDLAFTDSPLKVSNSSILIVAKNHISAFKSGGEQIFDRLQVYDIGSAALNRAGTEALYVGAASSFSYGQRLQRLQISSNQNSQIELSAVERFSATPQNLAISVLESNASSPDGSIFLLGDNNLDANRRTLTAINASGAVRWESQIATAGGNEAFFGASSSSACFSGDSPDSGNGLHRIRCFDARTGAPQFDLTRTRVNPYRGVSLKVLNNRVLLVEGETAEGTDMFYSSVSNSGQIMFKRQIPDFSYRWAFHQKGLLTLSGGTQFGANGQATTQDTLLSAWDLQGQLLWQKNYPFANSSPEAIIALQNGILLTLGEKAADGSLVPVFEYLDFSGQQIWRKQVEGGGYTQRISRFPGAAEFSVTEELREATASFYLLRAYYGNGAFPGLRSELQKFDLRSGTEIWHAELNVDPNVNTKALLLPTDPINQKPGIVVIGKSQFGAQQVELLDTVTGTSLAIQAAPKDTEFFPITNDITGVFSTDHLNSQRFSLLRANWTAVPPVPVLNPHHIGAWHNPANPGQGFFLEQIGSTQFLAWFHNDWGVLDPTGARDFLSPARQRWLTLQGDVVQGATSAALKIYDTGGGTFTSASAGAPKEVGSATLTFHGCDAATLTYEVRSQRCTSSICAPEQQFAMLHANIPLKPLVPATACTTATVSAPISPKSGLFHDPNVSGQGLLTVAGANTFFAGWFASDPRDAVDDPQKQVWFTLQADMAADSGNIVNAKIYRTLGGRRDTSDPSMSQEVGTATLSYRDCAHLEMQYQFGAAEFIKPFQNRSGTLNLERIGACRAQ